MLHQRHSLSSSNRSTATKSPKGDLQSLLALGAESSESEPEINSEWSLPQRKIALYLKCKSPADEHSACRWWFSKKDEFPSIFLIAAEYLGVPSTSASSERSFSSAGLACSQLRTQITGCHLEQQNVLHCNQEFL